MVNVKGRYKAHGSEQRGVLYFQKQKKQKGEPGMRTDIFPENGRRMMSEMMCMCRCMCMSCMCCGKENVRQMFRFEFCFYR